MFTRSAAFYDAIYSFKDYVTESERVHHLIETHIDGPSARLLDVGCGTGAHSIHLQQHYHITGIDLDENILAEARKRLPNATLLQADMLNFELGQQFDAIICLFGVIAYAQTVEGMAQVAAHLYRHLRPGGVALVEPFIYLSDYRVGHVGVDQVEADGAKIVRMSHIATDDPVPLTAATTISLDFHYLIGRAEGVTHEQEIHRMVMATREDYQQALSSVGFNVSYDEQGLMGRGLFICKRNGTARQPSVDLA